MLVLSLVFYNLVNYLNITSYGRSSSISDFISDNTIKDIQYNESYNLFFIVTPIDCECLSYFSSMAFIRRIKEVVNKNSFSINYIVSGDYSEKELEQHIDKIKSCINDVYIDKNNKAKMFIFDRFGTFRTPFLLILNKDGKVKYWQEFQSSIKAEKACNDLFQLLEAIS